VIERSPVRLPAVPIHCRVMTLGQVVHTRASNFLWLTVLANLTFVPSLLKPWHCPCLNNLFLYVMGLAFTFALVWLQYGNAEAFLRIVNQVDSETQSMVRASPGECSRYRYPSNK